MKTTDFKIISKKCNENMETITINNKILKVLPQWSHRYWGGLTGQHVFIIGCKGIPASYGGFETFVENLTKYRRNDKICYHVARMAKDYIRYEYNNAECFNVKVPSFGSASAVWYDVAALYISIRWCQKNPCIKRPVFYILGCRIGPFIRFFKIRIKGLGGILYVNPDGQEWKRGKWNRLIQRYWKFSERFMIRNADFVICDSIHIQDYIKNEYAEYSFQTDYIPYGTAIRPSILLDKKGRYAEWLKEKKLVSGEYYLAVGRFVPENNFETMLCEFMKSGSKRDFVIITTSNPRFYDILEKKIHFSRDKRIKFVGTVYEEELLKKIRENAYAYLHGHEVGGTNPSLVEALGSTDMNLLLDVEFNREVAGMSAFYWTKENGNLSALISKVEKMSRDEIKAAGSQAKERIRKSYLWEDIVKRYEDIFLKNEVRFL